MILGHIHIIELQATSGRQVGDDDGAQTVGRCIRSICETKIRSSECLAAIFHDREGLVSAAWRIIHRIHLDADGLRDAVGSRAAVSHCPSQVLCSAVVGIGHGFVLQALQVSQSQTGGAGRHQRRAICFVQSDRTRNIGEFVAQRLRAVATGFIRSATYAVGVGTQTQRCRCARTVFVDVQRQVRACCAHRWVVHRSDTGTQVDRFGTVSRCATIGGYVSCGAIGQSSGAALYQPRSQSAGGAVVV